MKTALLALALSGCAAIQGPDYYKNTPTAEICRQLMTLPSLNVNHGARMAELSRRGEGCGSPSDLAAAQQSADRQYQRAIQGMSPAPIPPPLSRTQTFLINGKYVTCTTTGTVTNCF